MKKTALKVVEQQDPANNPFDKLHDARCKLAFMSEACYALLTCDYVRGTAFGCKQILDDIGEELDSLLKGMDANYHGMMD